MALNPGVDAYRRRLNEAYRRAEAAGNTGVTNEALELQRQFQQIVATGPDGHFLAAHTITRRTKNGRRVTIYIDGKAAAADAHEAVEKKVDPDFDLALAREFGTVNQPARPFFYNTVRAHAPGIRQRLAQAILNALK
jgi:hypothetical protein